MLHINDSRTTDKTVPLKDVYINGFFMIGGGLYRRIELDSIHEYWSFTPKSTDRGDDIFVVDMETGEMLAVNRCKPVVPLRDNQLWLEVED